MEQKTNVSGLKLQQNPTTKIKYIGIPKSADKELNWKKGDYIQAQVVIIDGKKGLFYS